VYISLSDRPRAATRGTRDTRPPVGRVVVALGFVSLLTDISSESVAAILPLYLTVVVGLSPVAFGLIDGLYQGASVLVRLAGGWVADRTDRPKWVALAGYGVSALARVVLLFVSGAAAIAGVVTADRIGKGIRTAPRDAMISSSTPSEHLGRAFGVHRTLDTIGAAIGPFLAFAILWYIPDGYLTVLVVSLAFAVVGVGLLGLLVPDQRIRRPSAPPTSFRWRDLTDRRLTRLLLLAGGLGLLTVGDGFVYLTLLEQGGFAATWFPLLYVGTNLGYLALAVPCGVLADRVGRARVLVVGHLALACAYLCAASPLGGAFGVVATLLLLGAFYAATDGVIAALAGRMVDVRARTSGIAAAQTVVALARMVSTACFGVLWVTVGPSAALVAIAGLLVVGVLVGLTQARRLDLAVVTP
jgi:MFS family permease